MAGIGQQRFEVHHKLVGMPEVAIPPGSTVHTEVVSVDTLEDGAIEITLQYLDHD